MPLRSTHLRLMTFVATAAIFSAQTQALDLGKALEDAAKQQIEKELGVDKTESAAPAETTAPASTPASSNPPSNTAETTTTETQPAKVEINWKNPSREDEIALGGEITGSILGVAPLVNDAVLQRYVNQVGRWVASQSERPDLPWRFGVIDSADLNAFAAPGGYILVTKGLYQKLENEAQLAGVLGHEIAHVVKKHHLKVMQKQQLLNAGASWLKDKLGKKDKIAKSALANGAEISARSLDKNAEFEADRMGMVLAARGGYDIYGLPEVLQTIGHTSASDNSIALLYKTHPHPDERLAKLGDAAGSKLDGVKAGKTLENRFYRLK